MKKISVFLLAVVMFFQNGSLRTYALAPIYNVKKLPLVKIKDSSHAWPTKSEFKYAYKDSSGTVWQEPSGFSGIWKVHLSDRMNDEMAWTHVQRLVKSFVYAAKVESGLEDLVGEWEVVKKMPRARSERTLVSSGSLFRIEASSDWGIKVTVTEEFFLKPMEDQRVLFCVALREYPLPTIERQDSPVGELPLPPSKKVVIFNNAVDARREDGNVTSMSSLHLATYFKSLNCVPRIDHRIYFSDTDFVGGAIEELRKVLEDVDAVCLTHFDHTLPQMREVIKAIKKIKPEIVIFGGGPSMTMIPEQSLAFLGFDDIAYRGNIESGFDALWKMCWGKEISVGMLRQASGSAFRKGKDFYFSSFDRINRLSDKGLNEREVDLNYIDPDSIGFGFRLSTSLGCRGNCYFCTTGAGKKIIGLKPEKVMSLLFDFQNLLINLGKNIESDGIVHLNDDSFLENRKRAMDLLKAIKTAQEESQIEKKLRLKLEDIQARINSFFKPGTREVDEAFVEELACFSGCFRDGQVRVTIGTEALIDEELRRLGKAVYTYEDVSKVIAALERHGIRSSHYLILSNPDTKPSDILKTFLRMYRLMAQHPLCAFPLHLMNPAVIPTTANKFGRQLRAGELDHLFQAPVSFAEGKYREYEPILSCNFDLMQEKTRQIIKSLWELQRMASNAEDASKRSPRQFSLIAIIAILNHIARMLDEAREMDIGEEDYSVFKQLKMEFESLTELPLFNKDTEHLLNPYRERAEFFFSVILDQMETRGNFPFSKHDDAVSA